MDNFEHIFNSLRKQILRSDEKERLRSALVSFMRVHPVRPSWGTRIRDTFFNFQSTHHLHPFVVAFSIIICVATGTSYAAEMTLPGDVLYPIKTQFNEQIAGMVAVSYAAKAEWSSVIADRRLTEAEELAAEGRLTPVVVAGIRSEIENATRIFDDNVNKIAKSDSVPEIVGVQSDFQATLQAHARVLAAIDVSNSDAQLNVSEIIDSVQTKARGVAASRTKNQQSIVDSNAQLTTSLDAKRHDAKRAVEKLRDLSKLAREDFGAETSEDVDSGALQAEDRVSMGDQRLENGDYSGALSAFQSAIRAAREAEISLSAAKNIKSKLRGREHASSVPSLVTTKDARRGAPEATAFMKSEASFASTTEIQKQSFGQEKRRGKDTPHDDDDHDEDSIEVELRF